MSGLSRTPGKRVWVHSPSGVRIPPSPPKKRNKPLNLKQFFLFKLDATHTPTYLPAPIVKN